MKVLGRGAVLQTLDKTKLFPTCRMDNPQYINSQEEKAPSVYCSMLFSILIQQFLAFYYSIPVLNSLLIIVN